MDLYCNEKTVRGASWADVENALEELKVEGFFRLSIIPWPDKKPAFLEIQAEEGNYLPGILIEGGGESFL